MSSEPGQKRGRTRSESCHRAAIDAMITLLDRDPYAAITMERIAAEAKVAKQTLYKWWPSKAHLAVEAFAIGAAEVAPAIDTHNVDADLTALIHRLCRALTQNNVGHGLAGLLADTQRDPELLEHFRQTFLLPRRNAAQGLFERAVQRGQLPEGIDIPLLLDMLYGALWYRLLLRNAPLDAGFAQDVVRHVLVLARTTSE